MQDEILFNKDKTALCFIYFSETERVEYKVPNTVKVIKRVKLHGRINSIEDSSFSVCKSLKSINIPVSVNIIGHSVFSSCSSLKEIIILENVNSINLNSTKMMFLHRNYYL